MTNQTIHISSVAVFAVVCTRLAQDGIAYTATERGRNDFIIEITGY